MKIQILVLKFLFIAALFIISNHNLHIQNSTDLATFGNLYYNWLNIIFIHARNLTAYAVHADWLPQANQTVSNFSG